MMVPLEIFEEVHEFAGVPVDSSRGALLAGLNSPDGVHLTGTVSIAPPGDSPVALDDELRLSNTTSPSTPFIAWLGLEGGTRSVSIVESEGLTCAGRADHTVVPGAMVATVQVCQ
jgi:hypothetical protein